jgi:hypothetical protein
VAKQHNRGAAASTGRIEALSDGVFAVFAFPAEFAGAVPTRANAT